MRRKMLVSNTRAVDQLIILQSPKGDPFDLGNRKIQIEISESARLQRHQIF